MKKHNLDVFLIRNDNTQNMEYERQKKAIDCSKSFRKT